MTDNKEYEYRVVGQTPPARRIVGVKINSLNDHIDKAAGACGFGSYIYARLKETNYILGTITEYPVVVRQFFETITPTDLDGVYKRASKFLFCGDLGEAEPDTATQVMPIVEEMIDRSAEFFEALRDRGVEVQVTKITPFAARFDQHHVAVGKPGLHLLARRDVHRRVLAHGRMGARSGLDADDPLLDKDAFQHFAYMLGVFRG